LKVPIAKERLLGFQPIEGKARNGSEENKAKKEAEELKAPMGEKADHVSFPVGDGAGDHLPQEPQQPKNENEIKNGE
jgi:hypothetical protein